MAQPENTSQATLLRKIFAICVICLAIFQFSENTADPDLWGHVLYGEHLLKTGTLMRADPYSWTANGHAWINHEILAEVAMALSFKALGGTGLLLLKMLVGLMTFFIALAIATKGADRKTKIIAWAFGALAVVEISFGFAARPQIFTALAFAIELWLLREIHSGKFLWAIALPPLFALWINTHGGVIAGIVLLFIAAGATTFQILAKEIVPNFIRARFQEFPPKILFPLWLAAIFSAIALLVNPYGFELIRWLIGSIFWLRPQIKEWNPTSFDWNHASFFFCVALAAFAFLFSRKKLSLWEIAVSLALAILAFRSIRNTPLFCIAALAFVPPHLADALERFQNHFQRLIKLFASRFAQKFLAPFFAVLAAAILVATVCLHKQRAWTMEVPRSEYPVAAIQFIQQHELRGNLLVFFDWGEECLWELPNSHVSIDGRLDTCYPQSVIAAHWKFYNAEAFDTNALNLAEADFALLPSHLAGALALKEKNNWQPVYFDDLAVVLVKNPKQFSKLAGIQLPVEGDANATKGRAAFPNQLPGKR
jgi:hypothetical protein